MCSIPSNSTSTDTDADTDADMFNYAYTFIRLGTKLLVPLCNIYISGDNVKVRNTIIISFHTWGRIIQRYLLKVTLDLSKGRFSTLVSFS